MAQSHNRTYPASACTVSAARFTLQATVRSIRENNWPRQQLQQFNWRITALKGLANVRKLLLIDCVFLAWFVRLGQQFASKSNSVSTRLFFWYTIIRLLLVYGKCNGTVT